MTKSTPPGQTVSEAGSDASRTWMHQRERGSLVLMRLMTWLSLSLGRRLTRPIVWVIALYFVLAVPRARTASRAYLARVLGRPARWRDLYLHILTFASTIHDRVYLLNNRHDLFDIRLHGEELLADPAAIKGGAFIFGAHLGSFEVLRALARRHGDLDVCAAMYPENARQLNSLLARINARVVQDIVPLGRLDSIFLLNARLDAGALVALLADRAVGPDASRRVDFLGEPAPFPSGAFRLAAIVRRPVYFMTGLHRGGNRYDIHFAPLADFSRIPPGQRDAMVQAAIERYAALIAGHCRVAPYNWFNFYDFWHALPHPSPRR